MNGYITGQYNVTYVLKQGVVIGDSFLSKEDFRQLFRDLLRDGDRYNKFHQTLLKLYHIVDLLEIKPGQKNTSLDQLELNFHEIQQAFQSMLGGLGGDISLLTTFNFGTKDAATYFIAHEEDLDSHVVSGEKMYLNSQPQLEAMLKDTKDLKKLNEALQNHLQGFYNDLTSQKQTPEQKSIMAKWAYINMRARYKEYEDNIELTNVSVADYFWGRGYIHGYVSEAFGTHLALKHPNALMQKSRLQLKHSVVDEHGGLGSPELFTLLKSTKGNTSSQLSGDIVVVDRGGVIRFNIQSKASTANEYNFTITYNKFLQNVQQFCAIYEKYVNNPEALSNKDVDTLFKKFSTSAWVPVSKQVARNIDNEIDQLLKEMSK